ncbi:hypothetical protein KI743_22110 [Vibrio sp. D420a]|uniref:hypothetical protein n=1 Tax=Vibrio sp. D420a TaxID=2836895 RepID=UPI002557125C|nr:hypothetical protein [Vibrio sp. D420a]MDK9764701.1 hypothetical protein [Vibrio sp. D420a]
MSTLYRTLTFSMGLLFIMWVHGFNACFLCHYANASSYPISDNVLYNIPHSLCSTEEDVDTKFLPLVKVRSQNSSWLAISVYDDGYKAVEKTTLNDFEKNRLVMLFQKSDSNYCLKAVLDNPTGQRDDSFGYSIAISDSGAQLAIGSPRATHIVKRHSRYKTKIDENDVAPGAVFVYELSDNKWWFQHQIKSTHQGYLDYFGAAISFATDSTTLAIGAPWKAEVVHTMTEDVVYPFVGELYIFQFNKERWIETQTISPKETVSGTNFANRIRFDETNNLLFVSDSPNITTNHAIREHAFRYESGRWKLIRVNEISRNRN